jgi:hypothetical protein
VAADRGREVALSDFRFGCGAFVKCDTCMQESQDDRRDCGLGEGTDFPLPYSRKAWEGDRRDKAAPYSLRMRLRMNGRTSGPETNWS